MAETSEIEELQSKLLGLIDFSRQDKLSQLCDLFKIPEADVQNKSRLTLTARFTTELEKQLSALRPDETIPFLNDCIVIAGGEPTLQKTGRTETEQERIKELEASIATLKTKQEKELQAAKEKLRNAKNETGASTEGSSMERSSMVVQHYHVFSK